MLNLDYIDELSLDAIPSALVGELADAESVGDEQEYIAHGSFI